MVHLVFRQYFVFGKHCLVMHYMIIEEYGCILGDVNLCQEQTFQIRDFEFD